MNCDTQKEVDELWKRLSEGGEKDQCGWLKDKFGVSWQIVPNVLGEMLQDKDTLSNTEMGTSHGGNASDEENRHTGIEDGIRGATKDLEKTKITGANVSRRSQDPTAKWIG